MPDIPYNRWTPLSVSQVTELFCEAPFSWGLAGGHAVEAFVGESFREHGDIDVIIFRDQQLELQDWLSDWHLFAADPPGTLRPWKKSEYLLQGIHDIWGHINGQTWQLQIMLTEVENGRWISRRSKLIGGQRTDFIVEYNGIPCIRIEVQLLYKAHPSRRQKDDLDFDTCLPIMSVESKQWLATGLEVLYPEGHPWKELLIS